MGNRRNLYNESEGPVGDSDLLPTGYLHGLDGPERGVGCGGLSFTQRWSVRSRGSTCCACLGRRGSW